MVVGSCFAVARGILPISEPGMPRDASQDSSGQLVDVMDAKVNAKAFTTVYTV